MKPPTYVEDARVEPDAFQELASCSTPTDSIPAAEFRNRLIGFCGPQRFNTWAKVIAALPTLARRHGAGWSSDVIFPASVRMVASVAGVADGTAHRTLAGLVDVGLLQPYSEHHGPTEARMYRATPLLADLADQALCNLDTRGLSTSPVKGESPIGDSTCINLAQAQDGTRHGALSPTLRLIVAAVADGATNPAEVAADVGVHRSTATRSLSRLEGFGLAVRHGARWLLTKAGRIIAQGGRAAASVIRGVAAVAGTVGRTALQRRRHRAERDAYRRWWERRHGPPPFDEPPLDVYDRIALEVAA